MPRAPGSGHKLRDPEEIAEALRECKGIATATAKRLGMGRRTLYRYFDKYPELREVVTEQREELCDMAEVQLIKHVKEGNLRAVIYVLNSHGRDRGWGERLRHEHSGKLEVSTGAEGLSTEKVAGSVDALLAQATGNSEPA